jgi:hypothetical protein
MRLKCNVVFEFFCVLHIKIEGTGGKRDGEGRVTRYTVIFFVSNSDKFGICTVDVGVNVTVVEAKIRTFKCPKCVFFSFNKTHDSAYAKFSTN